MCAIRVLMLIGLLLLTSALFQIIFYHVIINRSVVDISIFNKHEDTFNNTKDIDTVLKGATDDIFENKMGDCECGIFNSQNPDEKDVPILMHSPKKVSCNYAEEEMCLKLCSRLAQEVGEYGGQLFCGALGQHSAIKASVHSRICGSNLWNFTGFTAPNDICCCNYEVVACNS